MRDPPSQRGLTPGTAAPPGVRIVGIMQPDARLRAAQWLGTAPAHATPSSIVQEIASMAAATVTCVIIDTDCEAAIGNVQLWDTLNDQGALPWLWVRPHLRFA